MSADVTEGDIDAAYLLPLTDVSDETWQAQQPQQAQQLD